MTTKGLDLTMMCVLPFSTLFVTAGTENTKTILIPGGKKNFGGDKNMKRKMKKGLVVVTVLVLCTGILIPTINAAKPAGADENWI